MMKKEEKILAKEDEILDEVESQKSKEKNEEEEELSNII